MLRNLESYNMIKCTYSLWQFSEFLIKKLKILETSQTSKEYKLNNCHWNVTVTSYFLAIELYFTVLVDLDDIFLGKSSRTDYSSEKQNEFFHFYFFLLLV